MLGFRGEKEVKQYSGRSTQPPGGLRLHPITGVFHLASVASVSQPGDVLNGTAVSPPIH